MKITILTIALTLSSFSAFAEGKPAQSADAQAIDQACTADAATASCGSEQVGTGLLKCLWGYKKAHKDFKFSDGCRAAMKKGREARKGKK